MLVHATAVAVRLEGRWRAALLRGPSGAGKSDLALRLVERGWRLVADDYSRLWLSGGEVWAEAPETIAGRIEARGVGLLALPPLPRAAVALVADCVAGPVERLPEAETEPLLGRPVPRLAVPALQPSAPAKLAAALARRRVALGAGAALAY